MPAVISPYRLAAKTRFSNSGDITGTSTARWTASSGRSLVIAGYADGALGTITTSSAAASALIQTDGTGDSMFVGLIPGGDGAQTTNWVNTVGSGCQIGIEVYAGGFTDAASTWLQCSAIKRVANMDSQTWPSVTPTRENQIVVCIWGYSDNAGFLTVDPTSYAGSTLQESQQYSTTAGADSSIGYLTFENPPVGVPFTPATTTASSGLSGTLVTLLFDSWELPHPQMILGACPTSAQATGAVAMPAAATVNAIAKDGDVFFIALVAWGTSYTSFTNASWLDDQEIAGGGPIGWKRLIGDAAYDPAWASSPPETTSALNRGHFVWGLIRGLQRTGTLRQSAGTSTSAAFINYWTNVPIVAAADEMVIVKVEVTADPGGFAFPLQPRTQQPVVDIGTSGRSGLLVLPSADWTPGSPGTGVDADWVFNRTANHYRINFLEAALTWFTEQSNITAPATVSTVVTSSPGAKFIVSSVSAPAVVTTRVSSFFPRRPRPRKQYIWLRGLDGTPTGVLA